MNAGRNAKKAPKIKMKPTKLPAGRKTQFNIDVTPEMHRKLKAIAALTDVPLRDLAASALEFFTGTRKPELEQLHARCSEAARRIGEPFKKAQVPALGFAA